VRSEEQITLELAYLYPKLLNIYGDRGNILTLKYRCNARGINLNITTIEIGENIQEDKFDIYFIGGGQDQQQELVASDFIQKKQTIISAINNETVFLAICGGYQLLGKYYRTKDGKEVKGIEAVDIYTIAGEKRMIGNVICKLLDSGKTIVGFENHSGKTYIGSEVKPLAKVIQGFGNNGEDGYEGIRHKNVFGTYLHGSLLPKNPHLADEIISLALKRKGLKFPEGTIDDSIENLAHARAEKIPY
jgi:CobQ-like glutamine amidotransferase family enzyme